MIQLTLEILRLGLLIVIGIIGWQEIRFMRRSFLDVNARMASIEDRLVKAERAAATIKAFNSYKWRARAQDGDGVWSEWKEIDPNATIQVRPSIDESERRGV